MRDTLVLALLALWAFTGYLYRGEADRHRATLQAYAQLEARADRQNQEIERVRADQAAALAELDRWQKQPPEVRYVAIEKIREVKSENCDDVLDAVRGLDYDGL